MTAKSSVSKFPTIPNPSVFVRALTEKEDCQKTVDAYVQKVINGLRLKLKERVVSHLAARILKEIQNPTIWDYECTKRIVTKGQATDSVFFPLFGVYATTGLAYYEGNHDLPKPADYDENVVAYSGMVTKALNKAVADFRLDDDFWLKSVAPDICAAFVEQGYLVGTDLPKAEEPNIDIVLSSQKSTVHPEVRHFFNFRLGFSAPPEKRTR